MAPQSNRSHSIDFIKGVAAIFVVCLHCENNDAIDSVIHLVGRMAVPLFFIITGYYLPSMIRSGYVTKHIVKISKLTLGGLFLLYLPIYCLDTYMNGSLPESLSQIFKLDNLGKKILFARCPINVRAGHFWYLFSILYILCFVQLFTKKYSIRKLYVLIPFLFLVSYVISSMDYDLNMRIYYQNYLFIGFPYVLLGSYIRDYNIGHRISNHRLRTLISLFSALFFCEIGMYVVAGLPSHREHYLSIIPIVAFILIWASNNPQFGSKNFLTTIGREYSVYIYVIHIIFVEKTWQYFHGSSNSSKLQMLISITLSITAAILYVQIKKAWQKRHFTTSNDSV